MNLKVIIAEVKVKNKAKLLLTLIYSPKQRQQIKNTQFKQGGCIYTKHLQCKL